MEAKQKAKLERYLRNAERFLWGLHRERQRDTYAWLRRKGKELWGQEFDFTSGPYNSVISQLLQNPGIDRLIEDLVKPQVKETFSQHALDMLRQHWNAGDTPSISFLEMANTRDPYPFLILNTQFNYVERWGDFAGLWFEEIEGSAME